MLDELTSDATLGKPEPALRRALARARSSRFGGQAGRLLSITHLGGSIVGGLVKHEPRDRTEGARALQRLCSSMCKAHGWHAQVFGELPTGPVVLVSNHLSYIDPVVLCGLVPCCPVAKDEVADWPLIGKVGANMAVNFVRRGDAQSGAMVLRRALSTLRAGTSILNFPEGTTTSGRMLRFQRGVFGVARLAQVPVLPIALSFERRELAWVNDEMLLSHYARTLKAGPCIVRVKIGEAMDPAAYTSADEMAGAARNWTYGQLERVWPELGQSQAPEISRLVARKLGRETPPHDAR